MKTKYPISLFESVRDPHVVACEELTFDDLVRVMTDFSQDRFETKADAPLFSVTQFESGYRKKANATASGLVVLDIDDGIDIDEIGNAVAELGLACLIYTTASHRLDHHKFRVCVPLLNVVPYDEHAATWHAVNYALTGSAADASKVGCESLFYVPGNYSGSPQEFIVVQGDTISSEDWIEGAGPEAQPKVSEPATPSTRKQYGKASNRVPGVVGRAADEFDLDIYEAKLVTDASIDKYRSAFGDWHHARFALMMSIVGRAQAMNVQVTPHDVVCLFNQVDHMDGSHYQSAKHQKEINNDAAKAVALAL